LAKNKSEGTSGATPAADIIRKGSVITLITLLSRPLGYVREAVQAYLFGATVAVDAFVVAFNFPELVQTLFFAGATSAFLIPVCTRYVNRPDEYSQIYSTFINLSIIVTVPASLLLVAFSGPIVDVIAPGFTAETRKVTQYLFLIMVPVILLHTLLSVMKAFLNAREHFAAPELSGILWNVAFIAAALLLGRRMGIYSLAVGVSAGALLQVAMQVPYLRRLGIHYRYTATFSHPSVREARRLFLGALIATSIVPVNSFVGRIIGSYLPQGEVASLAYAFRIFILPASLFAVPVYTVMFSKVSKLYHDGNRRAIAEHIDASTVLLFITLVPATVLLLTVGDLLVALLYERGAFTAHDTAVTNRALFGYGAGLLFYALSLSFVRIFNALHDMKTPAVVGLTSIALNAFSAYYFMGVMGNLGIALATSVTSFYNFFALYLILKRKIGYSMAGTNLKEIIKSLLAGCLLCATLLALRTFFPGALFVPLGLSALLTVLIFGLFFKAYYLSLLRRRF
jgi:putative peptidoglycan lipid II flippase